VTYSIALAQVNATVGDIPGNLAIIRRTRDEMAALGAKLIVFPELALVGYPPEDLVLRPAFIDAAARALRELESDSQGCPAIIVGLPWRSERGVHNAVAVVADGRSQLRFKYELPNYGVFDEKRVFTPGPLPEPVDIGGVRLGVPVCEDMWIPDVCAHLARGGAEILIVPNGSPFEVGKGERRLDLARARVHETSRPLLNVNQLGGQDELVFDGGSFVLNRDGALASRAPSWSEAVTLTRWHRDAYGWRCDGEAKWAEESRPHAVYNAMMLGLRDYVLKNRFSGIVLGLSGGIDSALTAAVAVDAIGPDRVRGVRLPSRFTSGTSMDDAAETARLLGMRIDTLPIEAVVAAAESVLVDVFSGRPRDVAEENLQARTRGMLLMALSNKFGELLVTTGNKSEMSVGYATLYGDMCGGYSVLKDVYKTDVYRVARWRNDEVPDGARGPRGRVIPESSLVRPPTAELRPNQTDQDSLPPYDELDAILQGLVEEEQSVDHLVAAGFSHDTVVRVQRLLFSAEYKRRQAPPGVKITRRSFGRERRYPLTNGFREQ
jgi:NAD+ synthase